MNYQKQKGFILILTVLFLQICAVLSLYLLEASWLDSKLSVLLKNKQTSALALETQLRRIEKEIENDLPSCLIIPTVFDDLKQQPFAWWQKNACAAHSEVMNYYYVVEPLGSDECARIHGNKDLIADYYRLTILSLSVNEESKAWIQTTIVRGISSATVCEKATHDVNCGRQSWSQ